MAKYIVEYLTSEPKRCRNGRSIGTNMVKKKLEIESDNLEEDLAKNHRYIKRVINKTKID